MLNPLPQAGAAPTARPIPANAGVGLRFPHHDIVLDTRPPIAWYEVHPENYLGQGIAGEILDLSSRIEPGLISDHLSWSSASGVFLPDLLPLPYTRDTLDIFARNID